MISQTAKGYSTLVAAVFIHIILGNVYTWSNINGYLSSYLKIYNDKITLLDGYFIVPTTILSDTFVIWLSGYFEKYVGTRFLSLIGICSAVGCHLIIHFFHEFWIIMCAFILFGVGIGMSYYPILKTCFKYFPEKRGMITGIILCCFGLSPFAFTSLADWYINPDSVTPQGGYYNKEIAMRMEGFSWIMAIIMGTFGTLALIWMFPMDNVESGEEKKVNDNWNEEEQGVTNKSIENTNDSDIDEHPLIQSALSWRFHLINIMSVGTLFFGYLATNTTRSFGAINGWDEFQLQTMSKVVSLLNGIFRIAWGPIFDKLGFKIPYSIVCVNQMLVSSTFFFAGKNIYTYYAANILENVSFAGHGIIAPPLITKIFGMKNFIILIGITGYYIGIAGFLGPVLAKFVVSELKDYLIIYLVGFGGATMAFILTCFIKDTPFEYTPVEKKKVIQEDAGTKGLLADEEK